MKLRVLMSTLALLLLGLPALAQNGPKAELFGGYSFYSAGGGTSRNQVHGWQASVAAKTRPSLEVYPLLQFVGDFGGHYENSQSQHQFLVGPQIKMYRERPAPFAHVLLGFARSAGLGASNTAFMMGFGGGVDLKATDQISIRVVQVDWLPNRLYTNITNQWRMSDWRFGFGLVFGVGQ